jgi:hypothetical protein
MTKPGEGALEVMGVEEERKFEARKVR